MLQSYSYHIPGRSRFDDNPASWWCPGFWFLWLWYWSSFWFSYDLSLDIIKCNTRKMRWLPLLVSCRWTSRHRALAAKQLFVAYFLSSSVLLPVWISWVIRHFSCASCLQLLQCRLQYCTFGLRVADSVPSDSPVTATSTPPHHQTRLHL